jgi:ATP-dependent exoDNAse (exonuclease V) alpha subunit
MNDKSLRLEPNTEVKPRKSEEVNSVKDGNSQTDDNSQPQIIHGIIKSIIFYNQTNGFIILRLFSKDKTLIASGNFFDMPVIDSKIKLKGRYVYHKKYGYQFNFDEYELFLATTKTAIVNYLSSNIFKGIGKLLAAEIYDKFKEETLNIIDNEPERIKEVRGIGNVKINFVIEGIKSSAGLRRAIMFFKPYQFSDYQIKAIYDKFKDKSIQIAKENPFVFTEIKGIGFKKADIMANKLGISKNDPNRIKEAIKYLINELCMNNGNTYLHYADIKNNIADLIEDFGNNGQETPKKIEENLKDKLENICDVDVANNAVKTLPFNFEDLKKYIAELSAEKKIIIDPPFSFEKSKNINKSNIDVDAGVNAGKNTFSDIETKKNINLNAKVNLNANYIDILAVDFSKYKIYLPVYYYSELRIAKELFRLLSYKNNKVFDADIDKNIKNIDIDIDKDKDLNIYSVDNNADINLNNNAKEKIPANYNFSEFLTEEQKNAIINALKYKISIISGGPGTGKSTIIKEICNIHKGKNIALTSLSGKAAQRLEDIIFAHGCNPEHNSKNNQKIDIGEVNKKFNYNNNYVSNSNIKNNINDDIKAKSKENDPADYTADNVHAQGKENSNSNKISGNDAADSDNTQDNLINKDGTYYKISTIHRLLKATINKETNESYFTYNENNKLPFDLIVIDEMSMVDAIIFSQLLKALKDEAKLVLVGDVNQLPSVNPGDLLRDLINFNDKIIPSTFLTKVFRHNEGGLININAHNLLNNKKFITYRTNKFKFKSTESINMKPVEFAEPMKYAEQVPAVYNDDDARTSADPENYKRHSEFIIKYKKTYDEKETGKIHVLEDFIDFIKKVKNKRVSKSISNKNVNKNIEFNISFDNAKSNNTVNTALNNASEHNANPAYDKNGNFSNFSNNKMENSIANTIIDFSDIQVLTPMRKGDLGYFKLNAILQDIFNPAENINGDDVFICNGIQFRINDRVMQTKNNYDLDVFNGDTGFIKIVNHIDKTLTVDFSKTSDSKRYADNAKLVNYDFLDIYDNLSLAYALSIHKSQGSEFDNVIIIFHQSHYMMLKKNLLYTAITRGKKNVVIFGTFKAFSIAMHSKIEIRNSGLKDRLTEVFKIKN